MTKYFGTDGVRGVANITLKPEMAFKLGRCGGFVLTKGSTEYAKVVVARDTRASGEMLVSALVAGLLSVGVDVENIGVITTPALSYLIKKFNLSAGIMVSASHNPAEDNGIKFFGSDGNKLSDQMEEEIEKFIDAKEDTLPRPSAKGLGKVLTLPGALDCYVEFLQGYALDYQSKLNIILDTANGAGSQVAPTLLSKLNLSYEVMADHPDGLNINKGVGSTHPEKLMEAVPTQHFDVGFAIDGDGDRCLAVDEFGKIVDGDKIMYIIASYLKSHDELPGNTVVTTVMSNIGLFKALDHVGIDHQVTAVGDRYVSENMFKNGFVVGGEQSGHIILSNYHNTGDGLLTMVMLLNIMVSENKTLSELAAPVRTFPQKLVNIKVKDKNSWEKSSKLQDKIKVIEEELASDGRVLIRPSGTENLLRIMVEAPTDELVNKYINELSAVVAEELS
ncbi:phosphoglucosamine mutase [Xylocopilactobacillus apicola]|uniref:Phosphoglucosamine mutase n=1 Tax=Xylocopilactobacillus apicola TaxID=2932184 RepID=A0AAU9DJS8_9LACO|nr:phosphoglucosamine mutase [Xylocopilactobacillus apicola]BDR58756.1 phosphoglucosamine mutase [Xylocopilactobacillus apicola]